MRAISRELAARMGGTLRAESEPGKGSTFRFVFPCAVAALEAEAPGRPSLRASPTTNAARRILVVEDNRINQRLMVAILKKLGHHVALASSGHEALEYVGTQTFDLVLMDIQMPEMDGVETTQKIREREAQDGLHLPIIAVTAHAMAGDRERYLATGMDDYLTKPIKRNELITAIERISRM